MSADPRLPGASSQEKPRPSYKLTLFDRMGPDAVRLIRAAMFGLATFALSLPLSGAIARKINPQMPSFLAGAFIALGGVAIGALLLAFITFIVLSVVAIGIRFATSNPVGSSFGRFTMGGNTTPYREQYSREQALVMRGDVDEALRSFEVVLREKPDAIDPRIKAAELYAKEKGDHRRAAELFREVQRIPSVTAGEDVYATNRLVDLCTGPLADPGRALVELRRLIDRHPDSRAATYARTALAALKSRVHGES